MLHKSQGSSCQQFATLIISLLCHWLLLLLLLPESSKLILATITRRISRPPAKTFRSSLIDETCPSNHVETTIVPEHPIEAFLPEVNFEVYLEDPYDSKRVPNLRWSRSQDFDRIERYLAGFQLRSKNHSSDQHEAHICLGVKYSYDTFLVHDGCFESSKKKWDSVRVATGFELRSSDWFLSNWKARHAWQTCRSDPRLAISMVWCDEWDHFDAIPKLALQNTREEPSHHIMVTYKMNNDSSYLDTQTFRFESHYELNDRGISSIQLPRLEEYDSNLGWPIFQVTNGRNVYFKGFGTYSKECKALIIQEINSERRQKLHKLADDGCSPAQV